MVNEFLRLMTRQTFYTFWKKRFWLQAHTCTIDKAVTYEQAHDLLNKNDYDVVVLDIMGVRGFDLLEEAVSRKDAGGDADRPRPEPGSHEEVS